MSYDDLGNFSVSLQRYHVELMLFLGRLVALGCHCSEDLYMVEGKWEAFAGARKGRDSDYVSS